MKIIYIIVFVFFYINSYAHQPKLIKYSPTESKPHLVEYPEISKAYYGKLSGNPHYYKIESEKDFLFYTGILSPKINENYTWLSIDVLDKNKKIIFQADGSIHNWKPWYEPYARDWYWKGPEIGGDLNTETGFKKSFPLKAGSYLIKVYNKNNNGNYSLAVGEAEFFGSNAWEKTLTWTPIIFYIGPYMDIVHWKKFDVTAFIPHIVIIVLLFIIYIILKRILYKKN